MRRVEADGVVVAVRPQGGPRAGRPVGRGVRRAPTGPRRPTGRYVRQLPARTLYGRMMRTLAQTGNGWMTFKDAANRTSNQTASPENVIHLSNLCTEILEVTSDSETAVCNLGSINLAAHLARRGRRPSTAIDGSRATVRTAVRFLDRTIDLGFYPTPEAEAANTRWRPVGPRRDGPGRRVLRAAAAVRLARGAGSCPRGSPRRSRWPPTTPPPTWPPSCGAHPAYATTRAAARRAAPRPLPTPRRSPRVGRRCASAIAATGLRNSLMIAIAPTATIASIAGCYECIEPQVSNVFKRETLSGEFLQVNRYLVARPAGPRAVDARRSATRSSGPTARSRTSPRSPASSRSSTARPGSCRRRR